jgi:aspartate oxidase
MNRKESRGLHYNIGYPDAREKKWEKDSVLKRSFAE